MDDELVALNALKAVVGRDAVYTQIGAALGCDSGIVVIPHHCHAPVVVGVEHPKVRFGAGETLSVDVAGQTVVGTGRTSWSGLPVES